MAGKRIDSTLCYIEKDNCYLMLYRNKKKNDPAEGKWVGVGGKFEPGETAEQCLLREVKEETDLTLTSYHFCGIVHFVSDTWPDEEMYLFTADGFEGDSNFPGLDFNSADEYSKCNPFECDEGDLMWIPKSQVLSLNLWEGDKYFLSPLIAGKDNINMTCRYEGHTCVEVKNEEIYN